MEAVRSIVHQEIYEAEYGKIQLKLAEILDKYRVTRNRLATLTGVKYEVIDRYYKEKVERVDLDFLAKVCFVLNCQISDLLEYQPPPKQ